MDPVKPDLQPVDPVTDPQKAPAAPPAPPAETDPKGQQPPPTEPPKDKTVEFYKGITASDGAKSDMLALTGEDPEKVHIPIQPDDETDPAPQSQPQPDPAKPDQQPAGEVKLKAAGKEFTTEQLQKSYTELHREFHASKFKGEQERTKLQLKLAEVTQKLAERESLLQSTAIQTIQRANGQPGPESQPGMSQEDFDKQVEDGNTVSAVEQLVDKRMAASDAKKADADKTRLAQEKQELTKQTYEANIDHMTENLESFAENRDKFAVWAEGVYGSDEAGKQAIVNLATDLPRLKKTYATYLKANYDFSGERQKAVAEGESTAALKESLQPLGSNATAPDSGESNLKPVNGNQPALAPVDEDLSDMEGHLGVAQLNKPSFFSKKN